MIPYYKDIDSLIRKALEEDIGRGDITSRITIPANTQSCFQIKTKQDMVVCGGEIAAKVFDYFSPEIEYSVSCTDGDVVQSNTVLFHGKGNVHAILAAERTALNLFAHLCGIATYTKCFVDAIHQSRAKIVDTRKTLPGLRFLQKYAVIQGGGYNHRFALDDGVLIKDNHIAACGGIAQALIVAKRHTPSLTRIEVECSTLQQVEEALTHGAELILLDNMNIPLLKSAVHLVQGQALLEASGNVTLDRVSAIADTGVDFISVGALTHSSPQADLTLRVLS